MLPRARGDAVARAAAAARRTRRPRWVRAGGRSVDQEQYRYMESRENRSSGHSVDGMSAPEPDQASEPISWLSTAEAANRLGITPRTLYRFIDEGQLVAYRFGRVIR